MRAVASVALALFATRANGTSILEFDKWMKDIENRALSMQKQIAREDVAGTTADAKELASLYERMQHYFEQRSNAEQGIELSRTGRAAIDAIVTNVSRREFETAMTSARQLTRECRTCHRAYKPLE